MKTTIYWTIEHLKRGAHDLRFNATCWWLSQQVEFLEWRLRLESMLPQSEPIPASHMAPQGGSYAVRTM